MNWSAITQLLPGGTTLITLNEAAQPISFAQVLQRWQHDDAFTQWYDAMLGNLPYRAYGWELPALTQHNQHRPCQFIVRDFAALDTPADAQPFAGQFRRAAPDAEVIEFANLGGDAWLVAPMPRGAPIDTYAHLAAFLRGAPAAQRLALWAAVGAASASRIGTQPLWISTHGGGVAWLHVRIEGRPKYYEHAPYRDPGYVPTA